MVGDHDVEINMYRDIHATIVVSVNDEAGFAAIDAEAAAAEVEAEAEVAEEIAE